MKSLNEHINKITENYKSDIRKKAEKVYKDIKNDNINIDRKPSKFVPKGTYIVIEPSPNDGQYTIEQATIKIIDNISYYDLAIQLAEKTGFLADWGYFGLRTVDKNISTNLVFPLPKTLFD